MMSTVSFLFRVLGFTLLFVAALIAVTWGYPGGSCFPSSGTGTTPCTPAGSAYVTGAANAILTGHILFAIGAFMLGIGAGIKIHFGLQSKAGADREENRWIIADRLFNGLVFLVSVWILFALLTGVTINLLL